MTKIIGISGKKQSGKNTSCNIIHGLILKKLDRVRDFDIDKNGNLLVYTADSKGVWDWGVFDVDRRDKAFLEYAEGNMFPYVKSYAVADGLKDICIDYFGLTYSQVKGTDKDKNTLTHLKWEDMPGVITDEKAYNSIRSSGINSKNIMHRHAGHMTAREFMQFLGTEVMRKMFENVWVNSVMSRIKAEKSQVAIITDIRFPNEADAVLDEGGVLLRLTRDVAKSEHSSEIAMDEYDQEKYLKIIENHGEIGDLFSQVTNFAKELLI